MKKHYIIYTNPDLIPISPEEYIYLQLIHNSLKIHNTTYIWYGSLK